jgi:hypothetical protein
MYKDNYESSFVNNYHHFNYKTCTSISRIKDNVILNYEKYIKQDIQEDSQGIHTLVYDFDNRARMIKPDRLHNSTVCINNTEIEKIKMTKCLIKKYETERSDLEKIMILNAWNEWGEGCHLEPDIHWGLGYLEETYKSKDFILLVPTSINDISFVKETLSIFNFRIQILESDYHCFISKFILPQTRDYTSLFHPKAIQSIRNRLLPIAHEKSKIKTFPSKIYLSRKKRGVRSLINEEEVEQFLINVGFTILSFEELSVWDQIAYMYHADWFVANHGAGFTNCMFMKESSNVLEFLEYDFANYGNPFPHWKLANSAKLNYYYLLGVSDETKFIKPVMNIWTRSKKRMSMVNREIRIDIDELKKIINE